MASKRTKKQLASTLDALARYASRHKATSRDGYYVVRGMECAMKLVNNLMQGKYDHSLYAVEGGWVKTDEQFDAAMVEMLDMDIRVATKVGRQMESLSRHEWTEEDDGR